MGSRTASPEHSDPLEGTWYAPQGGRYELSKEGGTYRINEYGAFGKVGDGTATFEGRLVTFDISNALLGRYVIQFGLQGNEMRGTVKVMGMPVPIVLSRM